MVPAITDADPKHWVVPYHGEASVRRMITFSLVFDHRLVDGTPAASFLQKIKEKMENAGLVLG